MSSKRASVAKSPEYLQILKINGQHPYKEKIPNGHVPYAARRVRGGEVVYFNYALAKEMGLIRPGHPERMNARLRRVLLAAFGMRIINEYDRERNTRIAARDLLPHTYMATRYLALQHPGRNGKTSGDGRSVWNGTARHRGITWDVSSCGTGVTRLCPATAEQNKFFKTGNWNTNYGCGTATVQEGLVAALMSETFHRNGIATERVLAVIQLADGFAVNVRAGKNLLRPSHFFVHLKQGNFRSLKAAVDCFIERQIGNGAFPPMRSHSQRYRFLAEEMARTFARITATFEREYIFCWLDWDGDNILADGGIIDYGSVRQFGLYHREYRFDDGPRWSTSIPEQRRKARHIVQCFAQIRDFLVTGRKPPVKALSHDPVLALFDREFDVTKERLLLRNAGFDRATIEGLLREAREPVERFQRAHAYFEHARSARGRHEVADGVSWNAVYCTRDLLRELPLRYLETGGPISTEVFLEIALSKYATAKDRRAGPRTGQMVRRFQQTYMRLIEAAARKSGGSVPLLLSDVAARSTIINRHDRITGDGALHAATRLVRNRRRLAADGVYQVIAAFAEAQSRFPGLIPARRIEPPEDEVIARTLGRLFEVVAECRHGL